MIRKPGGPRLDSVRMIAAAALVTLPTLAIVWTLVAWWSVLPPDVPSQWSGDKVVSRLPTFVFVVTGLVIALASAVFAWRAALSPKTYDRPRRVFLIAGSVAATTAAAWLLSGRAAGRPDQQLGSGGLLVLAALFYGLAPFAVAVAEQSADDADDAEEFALESSEEIAWSRTQSVPAFAGATAICVVVGGGLGYLPMAVAGADAANVSLAIVASTLAVTFFAFARIRVTVDRRGLRARSATCGILLVRVRLADAVAVQVETLEPLRWGGWGYRLGPRGRALVLRAGPAIVVTVQNGREVAVTTPDAEQGVSVLLALVRRRNR